MSIIDWLKQETISLLYAKHSISIAVEEISVSTTPTDFEGDFTVVLFPLLKKIKTTPQQLGAEIGNALLASNTAQIEKFNIVKGFLNLTLTQAYWILELNKNYKNENYGYHPKTGQKIIVEFSSPNTNKPLHLGHLRNIFLGWSISEILMANGHEVLKTCVVNDRGIHICKSMIAWQKFSEGKTPETDGKKGDHFVGEYYVKFNDVYKQEVEQLTSQGMKPEEAEKQAPIMLLTQSMLVAWEQNNPEVKNLWSKMNAWVYAGFKKTYEKINISFDKMYYESNTYLLGKTIAEQGLASNAFKKKEDGSIWVDLTKDGLDEKLILRKDGTSVYITQDLGLAEEKFNNYPYNQSIYVIADEQNYHMKVLKLILQKLNKPYANGIYHLSYGMVELPTGKMKSREGTVVDADDMVQEMLQFAQNKTQEFGKSHIENFSKPELETLYETIGLGALKFFLVKTDPKKRIVFNPEESIDWHGFTATFIQYAHARIKTILREVGEEEMSSLAITHENLNPKEKSLLFLLNQFPETIKQAGEEYNPSVIALYAFNVAQNFNSFYAAHKVLKAETVEKRILRIKLLLFTAHVIKTTMNLLGINVPEKM